MPRGSSKTKNPSISYDLISFFLSSSFLLLKTSFEKIKLINEMLLNMLGDTPDVPRVLLGTMADLSEQR